MVKTVYDNVGGVEKENISFENIIKPLMDLDGDISNHRCLYVSI